MFPLACPQPPSALSASHCRERARKLFAEAVAEPDPQAREALMAKGEHWMMRWRYWPPEEPARAMRPKAVRAASRAD